MCRWVITPVKKKSELFACWNCFRLLLKALAEEKSFLTFFFFLTDKEDVSIQHLHRVTGGIQLDYNILFRWAIKISVATAKQHLLQDIEDIPTYEAVRIALRHNCPEFKAEVFNLLCWEASRCSTSRKEFGYWRKPAFWTVGLHTNLSKKEMATANRQENRHLFLPGLFEAQNWWPNYGHSSCKFLKKSVEAIDPFKLFFSGAESHLGWILAFRHS